MGLREDIQGVLSDIEKQVDSLKASGSRDLAIELGMVQSQLSCVLIEDAERATVARIDADAHEIYVKAKVLVRLAETSDSAAIDRALAMLWSAAMDDIEDDTTDVNGGVIMRRGEDAAAFMALHRMIERRADPEAYHQRCLDDLDDPEIAVTVSDETREWLRKHYGQKP